MLKNVLLATRAHYAALQHKASLDRKELSYYVEGKLNGITWKLTSGSIWVKAGTDKLRKSNMTKLTNRLFTMFPEATFVEVSFVKKIENGYYAHAKCKS